MSQKYSDLNLKWNFLELDMYKMIIFATCDMSKVKENVILYIQWLWGGWGEWICWAANLVFMPYAFIRMLPSFAAFLLPFFLASDSSKILSKKQPNQAWCLKYTFRVGTKKGQQGWLVSQHPTWINATKCIKLTETRLHNFTHQLKSVSKFFKIGSIKTLIHLGYRLNTHWKTTNTSKYFLTHGLR